MSQRGFTLLEVLVAAAALGIVLLGAGSMLVTAARFERENSAQTFLQRQATMIKDEMAKQIQEGSLASLTTCGGVAYTLKITNVRGTYCFRRANDAGGNPTRLLEDRPSGGLWDLLAGSAATLSVTPGDCPGSGGFCPEVITDAAGNTFAAFIRFRLRYQFPGTNGFQTMQFTTTIAPRNP